MWKFVWVETEKMPQQLYEHRVIYDGFELHDFAYEHRFATPATSST